MKNFALSVKVFPLKIFIRNSCSKCLAAARVLLIYRGCCCSGRSLFKLGSTLLINWPESARVLLALSVLSEAREKEDELEENRHFCT